MKKIIVSLPMKSIIASIAFSLVLSADMFANSQLFQGAESKVQSFNSGLAGIGVLILTLAIMTASIGAWLGWFSKAFAIKLFVGGLIFGMAGTFAAWLVQ